MGARAAALSLARLIPEQILTRPGRIFNLWPHSRGLQPQCGLQRERERHWFSGRECLCPKPVQCKPLGRLGPVTHCPVSRCYETAVGAGAVGRTGSRAAPSSFYGAPRTLRRLAAFPLFVQRNKLSVLRFTGGHGSPEQGEEYARMPPPLLPPSEALQKRLFGRISFSCVFVCPTAI